jgi:hypothetical protein
MNLGTLDSLRHHIQNSYLSFLRDEWELDLRPRSKLLLNPPRIEITCFSTKEPVESRVTLGEPLVYTIAEAARFGPEELERMLDHVRISINMNKLL